MRRIVAWLVVVSSAAACASDSDAQSQDEGSAPLDGTLTIDGEGLSMYPAFDPAIERYGIRTADASTGTVTVTAAFGSDAEVIVDERPSNGAAVEVADVESGEEIEIDVSVGGRTATYTLVYLPVGFPDIEVETSGEVAEGYTFLTLRRIADPVVYESVIDSNGVPVHQFATELPSSDFKVQPNGTYSVARQINPEGQPDHEIVVMNAEFEEIDAFQNLNLQNTDDHDAILRADGGRILMSYEPEAEPDAPSGSRWHSDLEEVGPDGSVVFEWSSRDHIPYSDNLTPNDTDYAHVNSVEETADGNLIASFRNTSQVLKIDRPSGEVIWRLGGRNGDFTFIDDPFGGPCAQHHAQELENGNILLWDNGSEADEDFLPNAADMCPNPDDPDGPPVARTFSRAVEYELDTEAMTATLVWSHDRDEEVFGPFTGSVQRLDNGNTLMGWGTTTIGSAPTSLVATEIDASGETVWTLSALGADGNGDYFSYRVYRFPLLSGD
jgi:hypothetical protein